MIRVLFSVESSNRDFDFYRKSAEIIENDSEKHVSEIQMKLFAGENYTLIGNFRNNFSCRAESTRSFTGEKKGCSLLLLTVLLQHPWRATIFGCLPIVLKISISAIKSLIASRVMFSRSHNVIIRIYTLVWFNSPPSPKVFTATILYPSMPPIPIALAEYTCPKAPLPITSLMIIQSLGNSYSSTTPSCKSFHH